jgi:hypothetical protein
MKQDTIQKLISIVEGINGAMNHGTWRDDKRMRLKDTPEWVQFYVEAADDERRHDEVAKWANSVWSED